MGRGHGGYTVFQSCYKDSGGHKVDDPGSIFVAERYIEQGYESVFRQTHDYRCCDLTIKTSDDSQYIKNIEVKMISSCKPSQIAKRIKDAGGQIKDGDTIALYIHKQTQCMPSVEMVTSAIHEARRKGWLKGPIEVWFRDKTRIEF